MSIDLIQVITFLAKVELWIRPRPPVGYIDVQKDLLYLFSTEECFKILDSLYDLIDQHCFILQRKQALIHNTYLKLGLVTLYVYQATYHHF